MSLSFPQILSKTDANVRRCLEGEGKYHIAQGLRALYNVFNSSSKEIIEKPASVAPRTITEEGRHARSMRSVPILSYMMYPSY